MLALSAYHISPVYGRVAPCAFFLGVLAIGACSSGDGQTRAGSEKPDASLSSGSGGATGGLGGSAAGVGGSAGAGTTGSGTSSSTATSAAAGSSTSASAGSGGQAGAGSGGSAGAGGGGGVGANCGYKNLGEVVSIGADIQLCLPPVVCSANETCLPALGTCTGGKCVYKTGYSGLATLPEAWVTEYCDLNAGLCNGIWHSPDNTPLAVAEAVGAKLNHPLCSAAGASGACVGIMAPPPLMVGNSQRTIDPATGKPVLLWGLGTTWASGLCYEITGPGGSAVVAVTDRCAGYCTCKQIPSGQVSAYQECSGCIDATTQADVTPQCTCVGTAPPLYDNCCGRGCPATSQTGFCDWCAANNHPHFDLDNATFVHVCGPQGPMYGSCQLSKARFIPCYDALTVWPPT